MSRQKIHFVCAGNTYRSRLAEAYAKAKYGDSFEFVSSGVHAKRDLSGPITRYAQELLREDGLERFTKATWDQTTQHLIDESDWLIFMNRPVYEEGRSKLQLAGKQYEIWDIEDIAAAQSKGYDFRSHFTKIKGEVDAFIDRLLTTKP